MVEVKLMSKVVRGYVSRSNEKFALMCESSKKSFYLNTINLQLVIFVQL
jgi:hypothetical protein